MTSDNQAFFSVLARELSERGARSTVSHLAVNNRALREHLLQILSAAPGTETGFVAPAVFENMFEWERVPETLSELGLIEPRLAENLAKAFEGATALFPPKQRPYVHQVKAWRALLEPTPKSLVVRTGTSSGKTEAFLVPILDGLARELGASGGRPLVGTRAIFLYPLNALIDSQKDRLRAGTGHYGNKLRFCLYNGNTPDRLRPDAQLAGSEVKDRALLREAPPPILVTNATMLEYMLVRRADQPILERSKGKLRWVVLDEAHTYLGTAAAELALLIRRVLHAFGTDPRQVRFIATSATIGDERRDPELQRFLADLAGIDKSQVEVVGGKRCIPDLPERLLRLDKPLPSESVLREMNPVDRADALASSKVFRDARARLGQEVAGIESVGTMLGIDDANVLLRVLDLATAPEVKVDGAGAALLPLRGHFYQRTQPGLWACINPGCSGRKGTALDTAEWPFGQLLLVRHQACPDPNCGSLVGEVVLCHQCGETYIYARDEQGQLSFPDWALGSGFEEDDDSEDPLADDEDEGEDDGGDEARGHVLLSREPGSRDPSGAVGRARNFDPKTGVLDTGTARTWFAPADAGVRRCGYCGEVHRESRTIFRSARLGVPFYLRTAEHALAEVLPPADDATAMLPARGRRLITFTDSRQGTAKHALNSQLQSERMWTRATIYHQLWDSTLRRGDGADARVTKLRGERDRLLALYRANPDPVLESILSQKEAELADVTGLAPVSISWRALRSHLENEPTVQRFMLDALRSRYAPANMDANGLADLCLMREFFRRPPRMNTLETLGLAKLIYPRLADTVAVAPSAWLERGASREQWLEFLGFVLDFFARANSAVEVTRDALRWIGVLFSPRLILQPGEDRQDRAIPWPILSRTQLSRVTRTLLTALQLDRSKQEHQEIVNALLLRAWHDVTRSPYLARHEQGYRLLLQECEISPVSDAWLCPTTGRVLAHTVLGYSPFGQDRTDAPKQKCQPIKMPRPPMAYPNGAAGMQHWLSDDALVSEVRGLGVWSEFSDRIALFDVTTYLQTAEHSAQVERSKLQRLETEFKGGRVNVLHCSTTMEMGVDIGGLSAVLMNNVPPAPANYIQRAGRAGRRNESRAAVVTMCPANAHGAAVFAKPMWPFQANVRSPQVALTSYRIVQRHVHSLLLGCFLRSLQESGEKLVCRDFFNAAAEDGRSLSGRFADWIEQPTGADDVARGFDQLTACTPLVGQASRCFLQARESLSLLEAGWRDERNALVAELTVSGGTEGLEWSDATPMQRAILIQLRRHDGEFLLRFLASRGYLPAYGFPLSVLPLVTTTLEELKYEKRQRRDDEQSNTEERSARRAFPSRSLERALTEYAPGRDVVINGVVRQPQGVTLNWRIPAGDQQGSEPQSLRYFWRCKECGDVGDSRTRQSQCSRCGSAVVPTRYLEPAGFAVDVRSQPKNATRGGKLMFGAKPIVSATGARWQALPNAEVGQYRASSDGWVFHYVRGEYNSDYVVCRHCGRTDALVRARDAGEQQAGAIPAAFTKHRRLRAGEEEEERLCPGADAPDQYGVWRNLALGGSNRTDVFELILRDPLQPTQPIGGSADSKTVATSLAVALREALSRELGIDPRELGWSVTRAYGAGEGHRVIALYDTADGGAGYSTQAGEYLPSLLKAARAVLGCPNNCDKACHACLLTFDTQRVVDRLDRRAALSALSDALLDSLELPSDAAAFGDGTKAEFRTLGEAFLAFRQRAPVERVRVYWGSSVEDWEWHSWWLKTHLVQLVAEKANVEIVIPPAAVKALNWQESQQVSRQLEGAGFQLRISEAPALARPNWHVALELQGGGRVLRWALSDAAALAPGDTWGSGGSDSRCVRVAASGWPHLGGKVVQPRSIEKPTPGTARVVEIGAGKVGLKKFGPWFAERTFGTLRGAALSFPTDSGLVSVDYSDRYLRSPLVACLLRNVLAELKSFGLGEATSVMIHTMADAEYRPSYSLSHNWTQADAQRTVIEAQLKALGCTAAVDLVGSKRGIGHERILLLEWEDGERRRITLDQGLGFARSVAQRFDFSAAPAEQVQLLDNVDVLLTVEEPTRLWVEAT